jgi:O-antigen ligase
MFPLQARPLTNILITGSSWALMVTMFVLSGPREWSLYSLGIFLVFGLGLWITYFKKSLLSLQNNWLYIAPPFTYFLIVLISYIFSQPDVAKLTERLMFLVIPILGYPFFTSEKLKRDLFKYLKAYIFGIVLIALYLVFNTLISIIGAADYEGSVFLYLKVHSYLITSSYFSVLEHPSYFAMKIVWILILLYFLFRELGFSAIIVFTLSLFLSFIVILLASKSALIIWVAFVLFVVVRYLYDKKMKLATLIGAGLLIVTVSFLLLKDMRRIEVFLSGISSGLSEGQIEWKNLDARTRLWYSAIQIIKEKPIFGHGLGNVESRMVKEYSTYGWEEEARLNLNAHNQYLEAQMTFGIAGSISLVWMLLSPLFKKNRLLKTPVAVSFCIMISFFLLFESMFNRQWGIMFFLLFYCFLVLPSRDSFSVKGSLEN